MGANVGAGGNSVASLLGRLMLGTISNCRALECDVSGRRSVGGLVGYGGAGIIDGCSVSGDVSGEDQVGGVVGNITHGTVTDSHAQANVSGKSKAGGLAGGNGALGTMGNSYATGEVSGETDVGGFVGSNGRGTILCCYSTGSVTGSHDVGGLAGVNSGTIADCFWDNWTSGKGYMCGEQGWGGTGCTSEGVKSTPKMQTVGTFLGAGWDFVGETENGTEDIWCIC